MATDAQQMKQIAAGRWEEILSSLGGIDSGNLDGKGHPCPKCGGTDRFSMIDREAGALFCRQCFNSKNGDGLAALQWLRGWSFPEAVDAVAAHVGAGITRASSPPKKPNRSFPTAKAAAEALEATLGKRSAWWTYRDASGEPVGLVLRWNRGDGKKDVRPIARVGSVWTIGAMPEPRPLYRLVDIPSEGRVYLVEGEKCADAAWSIGLPAVTSSGGSKAANKTDWRPLAGRDVRIVPDADQPGEEYAAAVATILEGLGATSRIVRLPGLGTGEDIADWLDRRDAVEPEALRAQIEAMEGEPPGTRAPAACPGAAGPRRTTLEAAAGEYLKQLAAGRTSLISLGLPDVDYAIGGGVAPGEMVIVAARPSHGKTAVALQCAHNATAEGIPSILISEEMSATALGKRAVQFATDLYEEQWVPRADQVRDTLDSHFRARAVCRVVEGCGTAQTACEEIRRAAEQDGAKLAIVDYAQLLRSEGRGRYEQVTNTSIALRQVTNETGVVLLLLAQLNRTVEGRPSFMPMMSDLRDSGQLEQDADVILFLCWPHRLDATRDPREYMVFAAKNRNRAINEPVIRCEFDPRRQTLLPEAARVRRQYATHDPFYEAPA